MMPPYFSFQAQVRFDKFLPADFLAGQALPVRKVFFHLQLGGNAGMVGAGHPQGGMPFMR